jgi:hypothetical protein
MLGHCIDRPECMPCEANCLGLPDGSNAYPGFVLTPQYLQCLSERTMDIRNCSAGMVFDPQSRVCSPSLSQRELIL